ncbi:hypothetical protein CALVIDRAFT_565581 [Calocera viscosa TUFC12733]|uniref:Uncharacterized protein n=1 Tax=Calocera viscosa (strain TUFC12733) TaxID=1330018 RepID=A0A167KD04_CALVF|nr:hypothetical protein CALVIDRAFT_565581 [Calocera viscosa TUFC12733]
MRHELLLGDGRGPRADATLIMQAPSHSTSLPPSSPPRIFSATSSPSTPSPPFPQHNTTTFPAPSRGNTVPPLVHTIYHLSGDRPPPPPTSTTSPCAPPYSPSAPG